MLTCDSTPPASVKKNFEKKSRVKTLEEAHRRENGHDLVREAALRRDLGALHKHDHLPQRHVGATEEGGGRGASRVGAREGFGEVQPRRT